MRVLYFVCVYYMYVVVFVYNRLCIACARLHLQLLIYGSIFDTDTIFLSQYNVNNYFTAQQDIKLYYAAFGRRRPPQA